MTTLVLFDQPWTLGALRIAQANFPQPIKVLVVHRGTKTTALEGVNYLSHDEFQMLPGQDYKVVIDCRTTLREDCRMAQLREACRAVMVGLKRSQPKSVELFALKGNGLESVALV